MNLYLVKRIDDFDYDNFDSFVVAAESEEEAKNTHPAEYVTHLKDGFWMETSTNGKEYKVFQSSWLEPNQLDTLKVEFLGTTIKDKGVILASFNAG